MVIDCEMCLDGSFEPGDVLSLRPENLPADVDKFLKLVQFEVDPDALIQIQSRSRGARAVDF